MNYKNILFMVFVLLFSMSFVSALDVELVSLSTNPTVASDGDLVNVLYTVRYTGTGADSDTLDVKICEILNDDKNCFSKTLNKGQSVNLDSSFVMGESDALFMVEIDSGDKDSDTSNNKGEVSVTFKANVAPVFSKDKVELEGFEGLKLDEYNFAAIVSDDDELTFSTVGADFPDFLSLDSTSGKLTSSVLTSDNVGTYDFYVVASDGSLEASIPVRVVVKAGSEFSDDVPSISCDSFTLGSSTSELGSSVSSNFNMKNIGSVPIKSVKLMSTNLPSSVTLHTSLVQSMYVNEVVSQSASITLNSDLSVKSYTATFNVTGINDKSSTKVCSFNVNFKQLFELENIEFKVTGEDRDDGDINLGDSIDVYPGDRVTLEFELKNNFDQKLDHVKVNLDSDDLDVDDEDVDVDDIKEGRSKTSDKFEFIVPYKDLDDGDTVSLHVVITAEDEDNNEYEISGDIDFEINKKNYLLKFSEVDLSPSVLRCDSSADLFVQIANYGDEDVDDLKLDVSIPELSFSSVDRDLDVDSADDERFTISLTDALRGAKAGTYEIKLSMEYDDGDESDDYSLTAEVVCGGSTHSSSTSSSYRPSSNSGSTNSNVVVSTQSGLVDMSNVVVGVATDDDSKELKVKSDDSNYTLFLVGVFVLLMLVLIFLISFASKSKSKRR